MLTASGPPSPTGPATPPCRGRADAVTIDRGAANPLVTLSSGAQAIASLVANERLTLTGGTLTAGTIQVGSTLTLAGGTLQNAILSTTAGGTVVIGTNGASTLANITANADLDMSTNGAIVNVLGGLVLNATLSMGQFTQFLFASPGNQTLSGTGTIFFQNTGVNTLDLTGSASTLTIGSGITIRGGGSSNLSGNIGYSTYYGGGATTSVVNQGTINADTAGTQINIIPHNGTFTNTGVIEASSGGILNVQGLTGTAGTTVINGGILNIFGSLTQANLGTISRTGGTLNLSGV